jgi:hypothetical protein
MAHILQTRGSHGFIDTIAKFDRPVSQEEVQAKYGSGYYCLKQTSPRFKVVWKGWIGKQKQEDNANRQSQEIQSLKKRSNYLALGEGVLAVGEIVGFGLTASKFVSNDHRLNRVEAIIAAVNSRTPIGFVCPSCMQPLTDLIDPFCGSCGARIDWTDARRASRPESQLCPHCLYPVKLTQHFCTQCGKPLQVQGLGGAGCQFVPVRRRSLN